MITYFSWWYGRGLLSYWQAIQVMTDKIYSYFSINLLASTLFDPWKRDSYCVENASLDVRIKIMFDNLLSRVVGAVIRLGTIVFGLAATIVFFVFLLISFVIWFLLPLVVIGLVINGVRTIING